MDKKIIGALVASLFVFVAAMAFAQNSPSVRWEYLITNTTSVQRLNQLGSEGWELVAVIGNPAANNDRQYFRRRLP